MNRKIKFAVAAFAVSTMVFSCKPQTATNDVEGAKSEVSESKGGVVSDLKIAYINNDTLINNYEFFVELKTAYESKAEKIQAELQNKSRALERKMVSAQEKVEKGLVTRAEAMQLEQSLQSDQQQLMAYRDKVLAELGEEEQVMFNKLQDAVTTYIDKFNETAKYDLILNQNSTTNTIIIGNPNLDITKEVLEGLNKDYVAKKSATPAK